MLYGEILGKQNKPTNKKPTQADSLEDKEELVSRRARPAGKLWVTGVNSASLELCPLTLINCLALSSNVEGQMQLLVCPSNVLFLHLGDVPLNSSDQAPKPRLTPFCLSGTTLHGTDTAPHSRVRD